MVESVSGLIISVQIQSWKMYSEIQSISVLTKPKVLSSCNKQDLKLFAQTIANYFLEEDIRHGSEIANSNTFSSPRTWHNLISITSPFLQKRDYLYVRSLHRDLSSSLVKCHLVCFLFKNTVCIDH